MSSLIMPSGRVFDDRDQSIARGFALNKVVEYRPGKSFKLKSGILSEVYVNGRDDLTSDHALLHLVAQKDSSATKSPVDVLASFA
jgi:orotate phosphoribosyltransferase